MVFAFCTSFALATPASGQGTHDEDSMAEDASATEPAPSTSEDSEPNADEARRHFELGMRALQSARFHDAVRELTVSHRLLPNVANAFNLAVALLRVARVRESVTLFEDLLSGSFGELEAAQRSAIQTRIDEAERALAELHVHVVGTEIARISVDGADVGETQSGVLTVRVDPGPRRVEATAAGFDDAAETTRAESGAAATVELTLSPRSQETSSSSTRRRRRWLAVTLSLVAAGTAGLILGLALHDRSKDPVVDPVTGIGETLRPSPGFHF